MGWFYEQTPEHLLRLSGPWCASYSGGKDSTSLVTWVEWLRRAGLIDAPRPQLVMSDTGVEDERLGQVSRDMMDLLRHSGWECEVVRPAIHERLYNRILGIGNTPIHPGIRRMRWCTRSTKIEPMERWRKHHSSGLTLTGLRLGESAMRDGKIKARGCAAGGECGIPDPSDRTYSPILRWRTCQVVDWLTGAVGDDVRAAMKDVFAITNRLAVIYDVKLMPRPSMFGEDDPDVSVARFGCIGCPAIQSERHAPRSVVARHGDSPLGELYDVWFEARRQINRCWKPPKVSTGNRGYGPIKMTVRRHLFDRVMDIQARAGLALVTPGDEVFIRDCWARKVYPRGWSAIDEATTPPSATPLLSLCEANA